jgi:hypothetical protein
VGQNLGDPHPAPSPGGRGACPPCLRWRPARTFSQCVAGQRE